MLLSRDIVRQYFDTISEEEQTEIMSDAYNALTRLIAPLDLHMIYACREADTFPEDDVLQRKTQELRAVHDELRMDAICQYIIRKYKYEYKLGDMDQDLFAESARLDFAHASAVRDVYRLVAERKHVV